MPSYEVTQQGLKVRQVDVLVLGGGMAGSFAAMAARERGASVILVEPTNILGGQGTAGGVAGFCGDSVRVNDLFAELVARLERCGRIDPYDPNDDRRAYDLEICGFLLQEFVAEKGVEIWLHAKAIDARAAERRVDRVLVSCGASLIEVRPGLVIDATGNAIVPDMIGLRTINLGPLKQLPMSLYFTLWDTRREVKPFLPPGCPSWERDEDLPMTSLHCFADGRVEVKMKVVGFDAADGVSLSRAEIHARRQMMGLIYYLQTKGYRGRHAPLGGKPLSTHVLASVSRAIGQREGRRIVGRTTITDAEARSALTADDAIAVGTYHLDYHWTDTEKRAGTGVTDMVEPYHIPLRAMIPGGVDNVLCPGRSLSGEQMAMSSYRVMATCAQTGFGAGVAAALAKENGSDLNRLDQQGLRRAIEAGGQSLELGDYGDYLRCLRFNDEDVPLPPQAPTSGGNRSSAALALRCARDGAFVAARLSRDDPRRVDLAVRRRAVWAGLASVASGGDVAAVRLLDRDGAIALAADLADGTTAIVDVGIAATGSDKPGEAQAVDGVEGLPGYLRHAGAGCLMHGRFAMSLALVRAAEAPGRLDLVAVARERRSGAPLLVATIGADVDSAVQPACIATSVGAAVIYQSASGAARFWQGPIERFAPPGAPAPTTQAINGRPYKDHLILETA
jgi:hypothetical protein